MARYGMKGHVKFTFQNTFGLIDTTSSQAFPILSETLSTKINRITVDGWKSSLIKTRTLPGVRNTDGNVNILAYPTALAYALKSVLQNKSVSSGGYKHEFDVASWDYNELVATNMLTVEVNRDEGANSQFYQDMNGQSLTINIVTGELVSFELELLGTGQQEDTKTTVSYLTEKPFKWDQCSIQLDNAVELDFESLSFSIDNNLDVKNTLVNTHSAQKIKRTDGVNIEISGSLIVQSNSYWQAFVGQEDHRFELNMVNADGNVFNVVIPNMSLLTFNSYIEGEEIITADFTAGANFNADSGSAVLFTVINSQPLFNSSFVLNDAFYGLLDQSYNILIGA